MIDGCDLSAESATAAERSNLTSPESPGAPSVSFRNGFYCLLCVKPRVRIPASPFGTSVFAPRCRSPREMVASFFTVTDGGPRRVAPALRTDVVWPKAFFFFSVFGGLATDSACSRQNIKVPAGASGSDFHVFVFGTVLIAKCLAPPLWTNQSFHGIKEPFSCLCSF